MVDFEKLAQDLISGKASEVDQQTKQAIDEGVPPDQILEEGLIAGMNVVGEKFRNNEFYVPEVLLAARAMKAGMVNLRPALAKSGVESKGKIVMGTVKGDLHDIGKNLVSMMLEGAGFEIIDLGTDVSPEKFLSAVHENNAHIVGMSALLTTTMVGMKNVVQTIKQDNENIKTIIGGAPVTQEFADEIGADGYSPDAASAVDLVKSILSN